MKISKRIKKYIALGLIVVGIIGSVMGFVRHKEKTEAIDTVKGLTSKVAEDVTLDAAYSKYMQKLSYMYFKDHEKNEFVQINGKVYLKDEDRIADARIIYMVDGDNVKFHSFYLDKMKKTEVDYLMLKIRAFSTYDSNNL